MKALSCIVGRFTTHFAVRYRKLSAGQGYLSQPSATNAQLSNGFLFMKYTSNDDAVVVDDAPCSADELSARYMRAVGLLSSSVQSMVPDAFPKFSWLGSGRLLATSGCKVLGEYSVQDGKRFESENSVKLQQPNGGDADRALSPDGSLRIVHDGYDLTMVETASGTRHQLTRDGTKDVAYGVLADSGSLPLTRLRGHDNPVVGLWSPDSRYFVSFRVDQRGLRALPYLIASAPDSKGHRVPEAPVFRTAYPGDQTVPTASLVIVNHRTRSVLDSKLPPLISPHGKPEVAVAWTDDSRYLFAGEMSRDFRTLTVHRVDPETGTSHTVLVDRGDKPLRPYPYSYATDSTGFKLFTPIGDGRQLVLLSHRDGRAHLYLYDVPSGKLVRKLTSGAWSVVDLTAVNARERVVFFSAAGRESGRDPYLKHFYRVSLDGGQPVLLTPEDADHDVHLSPTQDVFVDVYSTLSQAPTVVLRKNTGALISELWRTNPKPLLDRGWVAPERFSVTAADGKTVLRGTLYLPPTASCRRVPIVDSIYGGMNMVYAPVRFPGVGAGEAMALAQLGFAVFVLDARGTPLLDREARDATWGPSFGSAEIVPEDHAAAVKQLADRYDALDPERVGIYGHSWGGQYTARLMAQRPDVFKVGVASAGSYDNFISVHFGVDRWYGLQSEFPGTYEAQSALPLAAQIEGRLLLISGDADDDAHPLNTVLMAGALAKANRTFDMLLLPDLNHTTVTRSGYVIKRRWDHFIKHLMGAEPPTEIRVPDIR
ncbi:S9 family peptidase [Bradyrhizobium iriomotense]|uniref:Dipeptidyl peptidase IV n=1 Tax=Bradyrhizobium iriomotense TaxID=441950 RepID=A0ABQ6BEM4_9BRAD|nr:DPP IV N-terminal domain-containing protein [Bradyrhizobium iriomotense]GLR92160.1 dipeptidyl peptidase IV [Bradyrhizobium iriomotense]